MWRETAENRWRINVSSWVSSVSRIRGTDEIPYRNVQTFSRVIFLVYPSQYSPCVASPCKVKKERSNNVFESHLKQANKWKNFRSMSLKISKIISKKTNFIIKASIYLAKKFKFPFDSLNQRERERERETNRQTEEEEMNLREPNGPRGFIWTEWFRVSIGNCTLLLYITQSTIIARVSRVFEFPRSAHWL